MKDSTGTQKLWKSYAAGLLIIIAGCVAFGIRADKNLPPQDASSTEVTPDRSQSRSSRFSEASGKIAGRNHTATPQPDSIHKTWASFESAQAIVDTMEQSEALDQCMKGLSPQIAASLLTRLSPQELEGTAAQMLFDLWATEDPNRAALWAQQVSNPFASQSFLKVAALRWATEDLEGASLFARNLPEGDLRTEVMASVAHEAVRSNPTQALRLAAELPDGTVQTELIRRATAEWAVTDQNHAMKWTLEIEETDLRDKVLEHLVAASAEQDPLIAADLALKKMTPGDEQDRAVVSIVLRWTQTDPAAAAAWVKDFPEGMLGNDAIQNLVNQWANQDLDAAGDWLLSLPVGSMRNAGILTYSHVLKRTDAQLAEHWVNSMSHSAKKP